jgi:hypothetical protein
MRGFQSAEVFWRKQRSTACSFQPFKRLPIYMGIALYVSQKNEAHHVMIVLLLAEMS